MACQSKLIRWGGGSAAKAPNGQQRGTLLISWVKIVCEEMARTAAAWRGDDEGGADAAPMRVVPPDSVEAKRAVCTAC